MRDDGRIVGGEGWQEKVHKRGTEAAPENGKETSHSAHANGMNEYAVLLLHLDVNSDTVCAKGQS